jgi:hypothetical protein
MMRHSETMRAAPRLLVSQPIVCLLAALAAAVVLGVLGPIKVVHAADVASPLEGENFANKPAGTVVVNDTTLYSGGQALKFTSDVSASTNVNCAAVCDVVLMARGGQSGGSPTFSVNEAPAQAITNSGAPVAYTFDVNLPAGGATVSVTAGNAGRGHNAFLDVATFPASDGGGGTTTPNPNLLTANQSSVETDLSGISALVDSTLTRDTTTAQFGSASATVDITSAMATDGHQQHGLWLNAPTSDAVSANTNVVGSAYVKAPAGKTIYMVVRGYQTDNTYIGDGSVGSIVGNGSWQRITTPPTTFNQPFKPALTIVAHHSDGALSFNVDGMKVEQGSTVTDWNLGTGGGGAPAQCADGLDNDGDFKTDFGANGDPGCTSATDDDETDPAGGTDPVFVGAGDIASCASTGDEATANLLDDIVAKAPSTTTVFTTGDDAYESGTDTEFASCYNPTWGRHQARTRPTVGNHEYYSTANASGYFGYFGSILSAAGDTGQGYYSYDLGSWHMIALNSNCSFVGGCASGSAQEQWLKADLAAHSNTCTLAYWHHPRFSSKLSSGGNSSVKPFWDALYAAKADVVLNGHVHNYERFAPQTPSGGADPAQGIREFVVGTGGKSLNTFTKTTVANSQVRQANAYGVLKLTLHPTSYDWQFVTAPGGTVADSGSGSCHS